MLFFLLIGVLAGWLAGKLLKRRGLGFFVNLIIGCIGAFIGGVLLEFFDITIYGLLGEFVAAVIGAVILLWLICLFMRK
ncbi:GlsB/YeaQ/YmgE family stress response membrane protein [bacterium]|nr:GlsB/YeaQ/YmgE family stress response membrane protein [bacterium]